MSRPAARTEAKPIILQGDPTLEPLLNDDGQAKLDTQKTGGGHALDTSMYDEELGEEEELVREAPAKLFHKPLSNSIDSEVDSPAAASSFTFNSTVVL